MTRYARKINKDAWNFITNQGCQILSFLSHATTKPHTTRPTSAYSPPATTTSTESPCKRLSGDAPGFSSVSRRTQGIPPAQAIMEGASSFVENRLLRPSHLAFGNERHSHPSQSNSSTTLASVGDWVGGETTAPTSFDPASTFEGIRTGWG